MKKMYLLSLLACFTFAARAQWQPDGTTLSSNFAVTDINSNYYNMYTLFNQGKHVILDFSATWCGPCWAYHQTHVLDNYFDKYGPNGTAVKDAAVLMYEVDPTTTMADLQGTTSASQGDWITGTAHPICNESSTGAILQKFLLPSTTTYGIPTVFLICKDKKFYQISTSLTTEADLRAFVEATCGLAPLGENEILDQDFSYALYPNPANEEAILQINLQQANQVSCTLQSLTGQTVYSLSAHHYDSGRKDIHLPVRDLPAGIYLFDLQVGTRVVRGKIVVSHA